MDITWYRTMTDKELIKHLETIMCVSDKNIESLIISLRERLKEKEAYVKKAEDQELTINILNSDLESAYREIRELEERV